MNGKWLAPDCGRSEDLEQKRTCNSTCELQIARLLLSLSASKDYCWSSEGTEADGHLAPRSGSLIFWPHDSIIALVGGAIGSHQLFDKSPRFEFKLGDRDARLRSRTFWASVASNLFDAWPPGAKITSLSGSILLFLGAESPKLSRAASGELAS